MMLPGEGKFGGTIYQTSGTPWLRKSATGQGSNLDMICFTREYRDPARHK